MTQVRTFQAKEIREALALVKKEMGADALILSTKRVKRGLIGSGLIEVTAALNDKKEKESSQDESQQLEKHLAPLKREIRALREQLQETTEVAGFFGNAEQADNTVWREMLSQADIDPAIAQDVIDAAFKAIPGSHEAPTPELRRLLLEEVASRMHVAPPIGRGEPAGRVVAIVGPTGVGKTTTVAKIAAKAALTQGLNVVLITLDTYRVAGIEQLERYAELIGIPCEVARNPIEFSQSIDRHSTADLIIVDTPGRSQGERRALENVKACFQSVPSVQVYLALTAATRRQDLRSVIKHFSPLGLNRLIVTKMDETRIYGGLFNAVTWSGLPISYTTDGQRVPEDLNVADRNELAGQALGWEMN